MDNMNISSAQYVTDMAGNNSSVEIVSEGSVMCVPLDPANRHYAEIMRQVEAGTLTIQEAE